VDAIVADQAGVVERQLAQAPELARIKASEGATRQDPRRYFFGEIGHYLYEGDNALHLAAAAHRPPLVRALLASGADVGAPNRRGAQPLHYAVDGGPGSEGWQPSAQAETVAVLIESGADPNGCDKSGVAPLHRAVRNRCSGAVRALLAGGADPRLKNRKGSTPMMLASWTTGKGGSGSADTKAEQKVIVQILEDYGATA